MSYVATISKKSTKSPHVNHTLARKSDSYQFLTEKHDNKNAKHNNITIMNTFIFSTNLTGADFLDFKGEYIVVSVRVKVFSLKLKYFTFISSTLIVCADHIIVAMLLVEVFFIW